VGFQKNSKDADYFLFGDNLFRGYYTIHDDLNSKIGFAPHSTSLKADI
jgi:hypothetical protein